MEKRMEPEKEKEGGRGRERSRAVTPSTVILVALDNLALGSVRASELQNKQKSESESSVKAARQRSRNGEREGRGKRKRGQCAECKGKGEIKREDAVFSLFLSFYLSVCARKLPVLMPFYSLHWACGALLFYQVAIDHS